MRVVLFDMGLPMIIPSMFIMLLALIPVIFIEGYFITKLLKINGPAGYQASLFSNLMSTLVGIPITWFVLVLLQLMTGGGSAYGFSTVWEKLIAFTWQAPWLIPYENQESAWVVYAAMIILLIPYCLASWYIEYLVSRSFLANRLPNSKDLEDQSYLIKLFETERSFSQISHAIWKANLITYAGIGFLLLFPLITHFLKYR